MKLFSQHTLAVCILVVISYVMDFANVVNSANKCVIDIGVPSSGNNSGFVGGNWGGFLYGLAKRANQTGKISLNSAEQNDCLSSIKNVNNCGFQKLIDGHGSCSKYSFDDVVGKLGNRFNSLREGCKMLGSDAGSNQYCDRCLKSWEDNISGSSNIRNGSMNAAPEGCDFAVLISVISQRIHDDQWFQAISYCLGDQSLSEDTTLRTSNVTDDQETHDPKEGKRSTDIWIVIGCIAGVLVIAIAAAVMITLRERMNKSSTVLKVSANSYPGESSTAKISIKEVYSATDNLNESNLIGQGIAGKVYKGVLSGGLHVAIKHIINDGQMETFVREVKSLSRIKHPNLVPLLGYCEAEDECFLVYELCHNGSLSQWLFGKEKTLSWIQRLKIATDCGIVLGVFPFSTRIQKVVLFTAISSQQRFSYRIIFKEGYQILGYQRL